MARQHDTCWRRGAHWVCEHELRPTLRVVGGRARGAASEQAEQAITAAAEALSDAELWTNEGGSPVTEATQPTLAAATTR